MIENSDYLTQQDKEYINSQLEIGNVRSSMAYILTKQAKEDLKAIQNELREVSLEYNYLLAYVLEQFLRLPLSYSLFYVSSNQLHQCNSLALNTHCLSYFSQSR